MPHYLDGKCFRYTFIFKRENLSGELEEELLYYISEFQKEDKETKGMSMMHLHAYDEVLMIEEEDTRVAPVLILVFYGSDWMNFMESVLHFSETFPSSRLPREADVHYVLRDENQKFDDLK
jgi:hypothetical protein